jgi:hypothetical protein
MEATIASALRHTQPRNGDKAKITKNITKARRAETNLAKANAAKLADIKAKTPAKPDAPKAKGSGALIGVAQGALDGQPHTKRAVEEARRRALQGDDPLVVDGVKFPNVTRANDARKAKAQAEADRKAGKTPAPKATPKAAKTKPAPTPKAVADRAYAPGKTIYVAKAAGTWTEYMVNTALAHKSTAAAQAAHKSSGRPDAAKPLDFKWMADKGYIAFKA